MVAPPPRPASNRTLLIVLSILGGVLLICCAGGSFFLFRGVRQFKDADAEADNYAADSILAIAKPWRADELWKRADNAYKSAVNEQANAKLVNLFRTRLGNIKSCDPFSAVNTNMRSFNGVSRVEVVTLGVGHFEKGDGRVTFTLVKENSTWRIEGFQVQSPHLEDVPNLKVSPPPVQRS